MRFIIIGGDAAGMSAASRAKRNQPDTEIIILEQTGDVSYNACGMPYNIAEPARDMEDLIVRRAEVFREKQGLDLRTGHRAESLSPKEKTLRVTGPDKKAFDLKYDKLLIATGASPIIPDLPGFDLPGVMGLKSLADGRKIKQFLHDHQVKKVVIIGMGYIALEMCEALRTRDIEVTMVKPRPRFLPWMNETLSARVLEEVQSHKVECLLGQSVKSIQKNGDQLKVICDQTDLACQMVLAAIGVTPNSQIAQEAGLELGPKESIAVDRFLLTSNPDIYAAGDCADAYHVVTGQKTWIPLALRANRAGWAVADNISGRKIELQGVAGTAVFKVFNLQVARTGLSMAEAQEFGFDPAEMVVESRSRAHAYPGSSTIHVQIIGDRKSGRLLGAQMVGIEGAAHRINAPAVALHTGMSVEDFVQCDLAYAPPFSPVWDPLLTAANQLTKRL